AERIVLELREKLQEWQPQRPMPAGAGRGAVSVASRDDEATLALLALGYGEDEVDAALARVGQAGDVEEVLRRALEFLSGV
ncbi:MAG: Holliday junction branch migration protein RuvA, partial [Candidatus Sericytochromatia bacterium]